MAYVKKGGNGGRRPGSGRSRGHLERKTQAMISKAREVIDRLDISPIEVLLEQMAWYHHHGEEMLKEIEETVVNIEDDRERASFLKALNTMFKFRELAAARAVDAAPYVHPRLASVSVRPEDPDAKTKFKKIERVVFDASVLASTMDQAQGRKTKGH